MPRWDGVQEVVGEIQALKRQPARETAQEILEKVYKYVAPIMRKRHYRVHKLVEFLPKDSNLLGVNVNHGQRISLRLRYSHAPQEFLSFESVLGTMLHELCHNRYGPHDRQFFALLDELTKEMEDMMARGYSGDQFIGGGLGCTLAVQPGAGARPAPYSLNRGGRKLSARGNKLGGLGQPPRSQQDIRERAFQAAERRREADLRCRAVNQAEDLPSDEDDDLVEISAEEFHLPRRASYPPSAKYHGTVKHQNALTVKPCPEVICLLSDED